MSAADRRWAYGIAAAAIEMAREYAEGFSRFEKTPFDFELRRLRDALLAASKVEDEPGVEEARRGRK